MEKEWKILIATTVLGATAFLLTHFVFDPAAENKKYITEVQNNLLIKASAQLSRVATKNDLIISFLDKNYALGSRQLDSLHAAILESIYGLKTMHAEIKSFGDDEEIEFTKLCIDNLWDVLSQLRIQKHAVEEFERLAIKGAGLIKKKQKASDVLNQMGYSLDSMMTGENAFYFYLRDFKFPIIQNLFELNNLFYRKKLGLGVTKEIKQSFAHLDSLNKTIKRFSYKPKQFEYLVARGRFLVGAQLDVGDSVINKAIRFDIMGRYLMQYTGDGS